MPRSTDRLWAVLCYLGAMRVPLVALFLPGWSFTVPSGLLITGAAWLYGRQRSAFVLHHAREGFKWTVQSNLLLAGLTLLAKVLYYAWLYSGITSVNTLWHLSATISQWTGILISVLTGFTMYKAFKGQTGASLSLSN